MFYAFFNFLCFARLKTLLKMMFSSNYTLFTKITAGFYTQQSGNGLKWLHNYFSSFNQRTQCYSTVFFTFQPNSFLFANFPIVSIFKQWTSPFSSLLLKNNLPFKQETSENGKSFHRPIKYSTFEKTHTHFANSV